MEPISSSVEVGSTRAVLAFSGHMIRSVCSNTKSRLPYLINQLLEQCRLANSKLSLQAYTLEILYGDVPNANSQDTVVTCSAEESTKSLEPGSVIVHFNVKRIRVSDFRSLLLSSVASLRTGACSNKTKRCFCLPF